MKYEVQDSWDNDVRVYNVVNTEKKTTVVSLEDVGAADSVCDALNEEAEAKK
jgi:hypothetical protein